jgi:uncharacterized damage-inducible protein DinB
MEKTVTDKGKVIAVLEQSFKYLKNAAAKLSDTDLDKPAKFYGRESTVRAILFHAAVHVHEHLGQSIAYARMIGIVPPWTAAAEAKAKEKKDKKDGGGN